MALVDTMCNIVLMHVLVHCCCLKLVNDVIVNFLLGGLNADISTNKHMCVSFQELPTNIRLRKLACRISRRSVNRNAALGRKTMISSLHKGKYASSAYGILCNSRDNCVI